MKLSSIVLLLLIFSSCSEKYPGYKQVEEGLYLQLMAFDDSVSSADNCFIYELQVHSPDSAYLADVKISPPDNLPSWLSHNDARLKKLLPYLKHLEPGDRAKFLHEIHRNKAPEEISIWWKNCYSESAFETVYRNWLHDREMREGHRIRLFALDRGFTSSIIQPEVLFRVEQTGTGSPLNYGDEIAIQYSGHFIDGSSFDQHNELHFVLGTEGQVINGLEFGLIGARPGEKRSIVSPSFFAFGEKGSMGIVPPYTPVWYKVQIMDDSGE